MAVGVEIAIQIVCNQKQNVELGRLRIRRGNEAGQQQDQKTPGSKTAMVEFHCVAPW
jgi:hypothetical protein